ncbi:MAG: FkbM family methyltransferase [Chitinophagaceae bacterium]|nr:FkbM family methyltransferase [Chitinophagaceae bacterium]
MQKIYKLLNLFYYLFRFGNFNLSWFLAKHAFPVDRVREIGVKNGQLLIKKTGQTFSIEQLEHCKESLPLFLNIATHDQIRLDNSVAGKVSIISNGTIINGDTFDNFYVVQELFAEGVYAISLNTDKIVVCDVGMNVGVASLYFAGLKNVTGVYSYEPFPETYQRALNNFDANPTLKNKIFPNNAGVGGADAELEIPVIKGESAVMSTSDFFIDQMETDGNQKIKVGIVDIKKVLPYITERHPGEAILLKLDCEGAEYDIIDQLNVTGLLKTIDVIVIEWHMKGYESLNNTLVANNFCTTVFPRPNAVMKDTGMIYAVNTNRA